MKRRAFLVSLLLAVAFTGFGLQAADQGNNNRYWVGTWSTASQAGPIAGRGGTPPVIVQNNGTIRQVLHVSMGGETVQVRFSNEFGTTPLVIGEARIAASAGGARIIAGTSTQLKFGGKTSVTLPPGAPALSDPVAFSLPPLGNVTVSLYLQTATEKHTWHQRGREMAYAAVGNLTDANDFPADSASVDGFYFVTGVSVLAPKQAEAITTFGDSITDGYNSSLGTNQRWPDLLAARLQGHPSTDHLAVLNNSISGNRVLKDSVIGSGNPLENQSALARFDRDVLRRPGLKYVIVFLGINDITWSWFPFGGGDSSAEDIIDGYRKLIVRAHELGVKIFGGTITPQRVLAFGGIPSDEQRVSGEVKREAINHWIRTSGEFDGVIDFDKALLDPAHPEQMLPAYDSGDHIHPNDAGDQALANCIDLSLFKD